MKITVGIDIGQKVDPTAIAVDQLDWRPRTNWLPKDGGLPLEDHHIIRHLERLKLGTDYPTVAHKLAKIVHRLDALIAAGTLRDYAGQLEPDDVAQVEVYIDATGVGLPVVDMMRSAGVRVTGVYFTHGDRRVESVDAVSGEFKVTLGKAYMVSRLQALLQTRRIHLANTEEARALARELLDYEIRVDENGNDKEGAFKVGSHDDLVTALGLSTNKPPQFTGVIASLPGPMQMMIPEYMGGAAEDSYVENAPTFGELVKRYYGLPSDPGDMWRRTR